MFKRLNLDELNGLQIGLFSGIFSSGLLMCCFVIFGGKLFLIPIVFFLSAFGFYFLIELLKEKVKKVK